MISHDLKNKVVLIGGGAKNLGGLISKSFAKEGAKIIVHYNSASTKKDAESTVAEIKKNGGEAFEIQGDFTNANEVAKVFAEGKSRFGKIDIAINTVGKVLKKPIVEVTESEFDSMSDINSKAAYFFIKEAGKNLNDNGKICTIVTSLLSAYTPFYSSYAGTKAPVEHFTRAASFEFGQRGISVTAVGPGPMNTPFFYGQETPEAVEYNKKAPALANFSKTGLTDIEDIVPLVKFLVTDGWWITGQTILANGGYTAR
ncbi:SDR family oxidoreductase [Fluviispira multicolorata]|uniref:SDR family oxidoreductase n=1 Tax=Fluviispira multicolorata TaxID=2654512 RepID=A0A833N5C8_9BACT|nr:SDR family oxidoreductase [Fluviispira multicolorata]KAB8030622.1 SDR family oxidoreductase [Fluviispira multicolorata]